VSELAGRIRANLAGLHERVARAAGRAGRDPAEVRLLPITKMVGPEETAALLEAGATEIGENRVQDALRKAEALGAGAGKFQWELVGHLQTNKVRKALSLFSAIHSLDSVRLAGALEKELADKDLEIPLHVYVEVNTTGEGSKTGAPEEAVPDIVAAVRRTAQLRLAGLMTMGPLAPDPEKARPCFRRLRELLAELVAAGLAPAGCTGLSMGMSGDFEVAVEEGATVVRVGTAVFA